MQIDAHQHFWNYEENAKDFVWMNDDLEDLKRNFLPEDLAPLREACRIDGSIAVQAREVQAETDFLLQLAKADGSIKGVVGWLDLCAQNIETLLEQYQGSVALKGFRMLIHDRPDPDFADCSDHLHGVSILNKYGLTYDLLLRTIHLPAAIRLVDKLPDQPFVVDHIAKPAMDGSDWEAWKNGIRQIAQRPNVMCKLSGIVTEADWSNWQSSDFSPYLDTVLDAFGANRLMIGSDWPVCTLAANYESTLGVVRNWIEKLSTDEQRMIMGQNCAEFYSVSQS